MMETPDPDATVQLMLNVLDAAEAVGLDPLDYLAARMDGQGIQHIASDPDIYALIYLLWQRVRVTEANAIRFVDAEELVASRIEGTLERISAEGRQELYWLAAHRLRVYVPAMSA